MHSTGVADYINDVRLIFVHENYLHMSIQNLHDPLQHSTINATTVISTPVSMVSGKNTTAHSHFCQ